MSLVIFALFSIIGIALTLSTIIGIPGGWILLFLAVGIEYFDVQLLQYGFQEVSFGWLFIGIGALIQIVSELVEFFAGMLGAKKGGASKKGMWFSLIGSIVGALLGTFVIPIPLFGSLIGSILGAFGFAYYIEKGELDTKEEALKSATYAAIGRAIGAVGKLGLTSSMAILLTLSMAFNLFF